MDWDAIGAVGELVSGLAVLVTLIYLARQVSDAKRALRRQASQEVNETFNATHNMVASTPALAEAIAKIEDQEQLSRGELVQFRALVIAQFNAFENMYVQAQQVSDMLPADVMGEMIKEYFTTPYVREFWDVFAAFATIEFRTFVEQLGVISSADIQKGEDLPPESR